MLNRRSRYAPLAAAGMAVALLASAPLSSVAQAQDGDDYSMIVAGQKVGLNKIGETREAARKDTPPKDHYTLPQGVAVDSWNDGSLRIFYQRERVVQISIDSMVSPLPGNITTSSTVAQVVARHPGLQRIVYTRHGNGGGEIDYYDDKAGGIAFEFTHPANPQSGSGTPLKMYAVIVHRKGMEVIPDVGETRNGN